jgi:arabinofuranosyltransferase
VSSTIQLAEPTAAPERTAPPSRRRDLLEIGLIAAVVVGAVLLGWSRRWTSDDAFINFRVVGNLLAGDGPVYNAGERVEVATSPLWLLALTLADAVTPGDGVAWASVVLGLAFTGAGILFAALGARRLTTRAPARLVVPFGIVVFAALPPTWDFATSGLETGLSFGWLGLSFWGLARWAQGDRACTAPRPLWLYVLLGLGPLIRPDFAIIGVLLLGWLALASTGSWWRRALGLLAAAVLPVGFQVFRMGYYGLLIPNTAIAKESGRPLWDRGLTYLVDLVNPHLLWVPALAAVGLLLLMAPRAGWRPREWSLVAVVLLAAGVHALYVVRVGGDFMHARLLMPSLFLALCPVAVVAVNRGRVLATAALLAVTAVWAGASMVALRTGYEGNIGAGGIADERGFYAALSGVDNPVTLEDHGGAGVSAYSDQVARMARAGEDVIVMQVIPVTPETPVEAIAPADGQLVFFVANAGFYGVAPGLDVLVVDSFGLTDPVASHLEPPPPGRPGHEKVLPRSWLVARYGADETATDRTPGLPAPRQVATARAALECGALAELIDATSGPLTWDRFVDNVVGSPERTSMRIPIGGATARDEFC